MRCLVSPSPALSATARPPSTLPTVIFCPVGRPAPTFPRLKLRACPGQTPAAGLRPRRLVAVHAASLVVPNHFVEEWDSIVVSRFSRMCSIDEGYLFEEALLMARQVCVSQAFAISLASQVLDSVILTAAAGPPNCEISGDTVQRTLRAYVDVFLSIADESYKRKVTRDTLVSFLDALRGLASISHILLQAALEALAHMHPRESLAEYAFNSDVKNLHSQFNWQIDDLKDCVWTIAPRKESELVLPTISKGLDVTESFLKLMVARRQRVLEKAVRSKEEA